MVPQYRNAREIGQWRQIGLASHDVAIENHRRGLSAVPSLTLPLTGLRDKMPPFEVVRSRRGARVDESTCLESMRLGNGTVGSNPTLSAIESAKEDWGRRASRMTIAG